MSPLIVGLAVHGRLMPARLEKKWEKYAGSLNPRSQAISETDIVA